MKLFLSTFILFLYLLPQAQTIYIPIKVGNKFGICDENKKILLSAQFDKIDLDNTRQGYFIGFKNAEAGFNTSLIYKNKIILKDQDFFAYGIYQDLIVGVDTTSLTRMLFYNHHHFEKMSLFSKQASAY